MNGLRRREAGLALAAGLLVLFALLAVFAIEIANTQAKSKQDVESRVQERGVLAGALIDSLFQTVAQQIPQDQRLYGGPVVPVRTMNAQRATNLYLALLDAQGHVIAHSAGFTPQAQANLVNSPAIGLVRSGHLYGLGDVRPYGRTGTIQLAVAFPTAYGKRTLVSGLAPGALDAFLSGELRKIPGVRGAANYLVDGRRAVISSTSRARPTGYVFTLPVDVRALAHRSYEGGGTYYAQVPIANSTWRIVLADPAGPLFASVSGIRKWIPWIIFLAFAAAALLALVLGRRVLAAAAQAHRANLRLGEVNEELERTNATLERRAGELARSNSELDQFASIASHDLQEPLRKVRTFIEQVSVREGANLSDRGHDQLSRANSAAERMQRLIEDLLKFSRVSTQGRTFAPVDLGILVHEVLDDLEAPIRESGARVAYGELPTVSGDGSQLRQLMQNLLSNAIKFHREGVPPEVRIAVSVSDGTATISVADNGIGFEPQYSRRIFRIFERLHGRNAYPGTGIGLALCRKIVERHGGTIVADSAVGEGSTFTVTMPVDQREEVLVFPAHDEGLDAQVALSDHDARRTVAV